MAFRIVSGVLLVALVALRAAPTRDAFRESGGLPDEGRLGNLGRRILGVWFFLPLLLHLIWPPYIAFAAMGLPGWARWAGAGVVVLSLVLLAWCHGTLRRGFALVPRVTGEQTLVTAGPYRWARHPMYTSELALVAGYGLLLDDWIMLSCLVPSLLFILARIPREEALLTERFGQAYRDYSRRTGRFLPGL